MYGLVKNLGQFFGIYGFGTPDIQRCILNFIGLATDSQQLSSRELSLSHRIVSSE